MSRNEPRLVDRNHSERFFLCLAKEFSFYPEGTGEPLKDFKLRSAGRFTVIH